MGEEVLGVAGVVAPAQKLVRSSSQVRTKCCKCKDQAIGFSASGGCSSCQQKGGVLKFLPAPLDCGTVKGKTTSARCGKKCQKMYQADPARAKLLARTQDDSVLEGADLADLLQAVWESP